MPVASANVPVDDPLTSELWDQLQRLTFDRGAGPDTFAARLGREQGWSAGFTGRAIQEYRRFLLLFALSQKKPSTGLPSAAVQIVPPLVIDKAWHLHLLYTQSYWEDLCQNILHGPLHHLPADGSPGEPAMLDRSYQNTLDAYRRIFLQAPPVDIWPTPASPALTALAKQKQINLSNPGPILGRIAVLVVLPAVLIWLLAVAVGLPIEKAMIPAAASVIFTSVVATQVRWRFSRHSNRSESGGNGGDWTCTGGGSGTSVSFHSENAGGGHGHSDSGHACGGGGHSCGGHSCGGH